MSRKVPSQLCSESEVTPVPKSTEPVLKQTVVALGNPAQPLVDDGSSSDADYKFHREPAAAGSGAMVHDHCCIMPRPDFSRRRREYSAELVCEPKDRCEIEAQPMSLCRSKTITFHAKKSDKSLTENRSSVPSAYRQPPLPKGQRARSMFPDSLSRNLQSVQQPSTFSRTGISDVMESASDVSDFENNKFEKVEQENEKLKAKERKREDKSCMTSTKSRTTSTQTIECKCLHKGIQTCRESRHVVGPLPDILRTGSNQTLMRTGSNQTPMRTGSNQTPKHFITRNQTLVDISSKPRSTSKPRSSSICRAGDPQRRRHRCFGVGQLRLNDQDEEQDEREKKEADKKMKLNRRQSGAKNKRKYMLKLVDCSTESHTGHCGGQNVLRRVDGDGHRRWWTEMLDGDGGRKW